MIILAFLKHFLVDDCKRAIYGDARHGGHHDVRRHDVHADAHHDDGGDDGVRVCGN